MAKQDEEKYVTNEDPTKAIVMVPDLFDLIDEEELNPPQYNGSMFLNQIIKIVNYRFEDSRKLGKIVIVTIEDKDSGEDLEVALTAWRMPHYFQIIQQKFVPLPFEVFIVPDGESYKFSPIPKRG